MMRERPVEEVPRATILSTRSPERDELDTPTLERCCASDPAAFRAFVTRYERTVFALLSRMLGRGPEVEDMAQETFLRAFRAFPTFDPRRAARPSTWLLTIATRLAIDERRRRAPDPVDEDDPRWDEVTPERQVERVELGSAIERAAATLSPEQRAVFVLHEAHDVSLSEIAEIVGVPEATVKTRLFRARQKLRALLASYAEDDARDDT